MKLVTFSRSSGDSRLGAKVGGQVVDLAAAAGGAGHDAQQYETMAGFIRAGSAALNGAASLVETAPDDARYPLDQVTLLAPIRPGTILCSGSNYHAHNDD